MKVSRLVRSLPLSVMWVATSDLTYCAPALTTGLISRYPTTPVGALEAIEMVVVDEIVCVVVSVEMELSVFTSVTVVAVVVISALQAELSTEAEKVCKAAGVMTVCVESSELEISELVAEVSTGVGVGACLLYLWSCPQSVVRGAISRLRLYTWVTAVRSVVVAVTVVVEISVVVEDTVEVSSA